MTEKSPDSAARAQPSRSIRYFAVSADLAGCQSEAVAAQAGETIGQLRIRLAQLHPALAPLLPHCRLATAAAFCQDGDVLADGAEVLVMPPVSGGAPRCAVTQHALQPGDSERRLNLDGAGGVATFVGVVRRENLGKHVIGLEYSAHEGLACLEMERIADEAQAQFGLIDVCCLHRIGALTVGEIAVSIAVAAPHRDAAFAGCRFVIDQLKQRVPIWKRETSADGAQWLGTPTGLQDTAAQVDK